jgi:uncharacterized protein YjbI with pentapeptide repeats
MADFTREEMEDIVHKLEKANLSGADLPGVNLSAANLWMADLDSQIASEQATVT